MNGAHALPPRQIHLSTCVVLMMVAGATIGTNVVPTEVCSLGRYHAKIVFTAPMPRRAEQGQICSRGFQYGFPMPAYRKRELVRAEEGQWSELETKGEFMMPWLSIPFNLAVWLGVLTAGAFAMEEFNHNRKHASKKRPREAASLTPARGRVDCPP